MNDDITKLMSELEQGIDQSYKTDMANLENQRNIYGDQQANSANSAGVMFSNYVPTKQIQYDAQKFYPAVAKRQETYLTSKDKIIEQGRNFREQIDKLNKAIQEANEAYK